VDKPVGEDGASPAPGGPPDALPPALGVLVVHGIGNHRQGETLNEFVTPVLKWIDAWLAPDIPVKLQQGYVRFVRGSLRPPDLPLGTPAHALAEIYRQAPDGRSKTDTWLFAESWWSPQTLTPKVSSFLLWLITRGPWLMLMHFSQRFGVDSEQLFKDLGAGRNGASIYWQMAKFVFVTGIWLALSFLLILAWGVVSLVALVPVSIVRRQVYASLLAVTGVLGDSYVLINDPIQRAAFANSTRNALRWLRRQGCRKLAVVAHSQGAAVACDVLLARGAPKVNLLVTLGPGIAKLEALASRERLDPHSFMWSGAAAPLSALALGLLLRFWVDGETGFGLWAAPALIAMLAWIAIIVTWTGVSTSLQRLKPDRLFQLLVSQSQPLMRWNDFHATHDPVSNGPLAATFGAGLPCLVSKSVRVMGSWLADHTAYWTSRADFVPHIVGALDRCSGAGLAADVPPVAAARAAFAWQVRLLSLLRWLGWAALLLPVLAWQRLLAVAELLHDGLAGLPLDSITKALAALDSALAWLGSGLMGRQLAGATGSGLLLLALLAGVVLHVWGRIVIYWWLHSCSMHYAPVFRPGDDGMLGHMGRWLLLAWVTTLGLLPIVLSAGWAFLPQAMTWEAARHLLTRFVTLAAMMVYALMLYGLWQLAREATANLRQACACHGSWSSALRHMEQPWTLPFGILFIGFGGGYAVGQARYATELWPIALVLLLLGALVAAGYRRWGRS
jgi:hypothetical protein